jgi:LAO/AO transport system kinase
VEKLDEHRAYIEKEGTLSERRRRNLRNEVLALAAGRLRKRLEEELREDEEFAALLEQVVARELDPATAARTLLHRTTADAG